MRLAAMQPYFLPYVGYFHLMYHCDVFVSFDTAQYIRHGWVNRNRIMHAAGRAWTYITVPVVSGQSRARICDVRISAQPWRERIMGQLDVYRNAPHFGAVRTLMRHVLDCETDRLATLNLFGLRLVSEYLGFPDIEIKKFSRWDPGLGRISKPGDWALRMSESLGADEYVNPPGGAGLFDADEFARTGVKLVIQDMPDFA